MHNAHIFADFCEKTLDLHTQLNVNGRTDPNLTFYKSLPICIVDAVFSIGVNYASVEKATNSFLTYFGLSIPREAACGPEYSISDFIRHMESFPSFEIAAAQGFRNRQRTSSVNGILKAEACYAVAKVFHAHGIETLADFRGCANKSALDADILKVKGQSSGIMLKYLYMLVGDADEVKPDRHMINFVRKVFPDITMAAKDHPEVAAVIKQAVAILLPKYPTLTPRFLDYLIWDHMRLESTKASAK